MKTPLEWALYYATHPWPIFPVKPRGKEPLRPVTPSGGRHLWFPHPGGTIGNVVLAPHLDVRADHGYVLLPPSVHPSGAVYRWEHRLTDVKALPPDVVALFNGQHRRPA